MGLQWNVVVLCLLFLFTSTAKAQSTVFDVVAKYGAKADGKTDLSTPLMNAWKDACASGTPSKVVIPKGTYYLSQIDMSGPCKAAIEVELQGIIEAPVDPSFFTKPDWVVFSKVDQLTLHGGGTFDGKGETTWGKNDCHKNKYCKALPINLRFNFVTNAYIRDITTKDSKQFNVNVLGCKNITFEHFNVLNPEDSRNTDGIHMGRSDGVTILYSEIKTGDDCISIGDGSKNVNVNGVSCGPGHGISIGSLGKFQGEEPVEGIFIKNCSITGTTNGVRIKSWPASYPGTASDMHFEDITMDNVGNPILIDQEYCPWNLCNLKMPSKIKLSKISFKNIKGTSSTPDVVKLVCSASNPCDGVELANIDVTYNGPRGPGKSRCSHVKPLLSGTMNPPACTEPGSAIPS